MKHLDDLVKGGLEGLEPTPEVIAAYILGAKNVAGDSLKYRVSISSSQMTITFDWSIVPMVLQRLKDLVKR